MSATTEALASHARGRSSSRGNCRATAPTSEGQRIETVECTLEAVLAPVAPSSLLTGCVERGTHLWRCGWRWCLGSGCRRSRWRFLGCCRRHRHGGDSCRHSRGGVPHVFLARVLCRAEAKPSHNGFKPVHCESKVLFWLCFLGYLLSCSSSAWHGFSFPLLCIVLLELCLLTFWLRLGPLRLLFSFLFLSNPPARSFRFGLRFCIRLRLAQEPLDHIVLASVGSHAPVGELFSQLCLAEAAELFGPKLVQDTSALRLRLLLLQVSLHALQIFCSSLCGLSQRSEVTIRPSIILFTISRN
mmetsp:Transcript_14206/g.26559  ORF Transcript_14206/g.26559 Transcript_14206/m.26559 type:complete len:300 (+) Transcript_14206:130-1029(+)